MEDAEYFKAICMHIRPEAYFKDKPSDVSTDFAESIESKLGRPLTDEEKELLGAPEPVVEEVDDDVDIIGENNV